MESQRRDRCTLREEVECYEPAEPGCERAPAPRVPADPDEVLVADPRGGRTPAQVVDDKLRALLGSGPRSRQGRRPENFRRIGRD